MVLTAAPQILTAALQSHWSPWAAPLVIKSKQPRLAFRSLGLTVSPKIKIAPVHYAKHSQGGKSSNLFSARRLLSCKVARTVALICSRLTPNTNLEPAQCQILKRIRETSRTAYAARSSGDPDMCGSFTSSLRCAAAESLLGRLIKDLWYPFIVPGL